MTINKIAIIRLSSIGDIALTYTTVRNLRQRYPSAYITFVTNKGFFDVIRDWPECDHVLFYEDFLTWSQEDRQQDWVIDLHKNKKSLRILKGFQFHYKTYLHKLNREKWLNVNFKTQLPVSHIVKRYNHAANIEGEDSLVYKNFPVEIRADNSKYACIVLGAAHHTKAPTSDVIEKFANSISLPISLIGGPQEQELGDRLAAKFNHVTNFAGTLTIQESIEKIKNSSFCVGGDTGMSHIAAIYSIPLLTIWGSTHPNLGMSPVGKENKIHHLEKKLSCRACSKLGKTACPLGHFECMAYSKDEIIKSLMKVIKH